MLKKLNSSITKIDAIHTRLRKAKHVISDMIKDLKTHLLLVKDSHVMLTSNL